MLYDSEIVAAESDAVATRFKSRSGRLIVNRSRRDTPVMRSLDDEFRAEATRVLSRFRRAIGQVVYSVTKTLANSRTLQSVLGVDLHFSWQVFKLLGPIEVLSAVTYMPPGVSVRKLITLSKKKGVDQAALDEVNDAHLEFEALIAKSTGDRERFETLVMSFTESAEAALIDLGIRKSAFKAAVHYFGMAAETLTVGLIFHPSATPGKIDLVSVRSILGLRRLRASTDVIIERAKVATDKLGKQDGFLLPNALDPVAAQEHSAAIVPEFCSQPILPLTTTVDEVGNVRTVLEHRDLGVGQEVDLTTARIYRDSIFSQTADGRQLIDGLIEIARPTRLQVIDAIVHRPTWSQMSVTTGVYAHLASRNPAHLESAIRLPFQERMTFLGRCDEDLLRVSEAPRYADLVQHACRKTGWSLEDMDVYRMRIEYPLLDSSVFFRLEEPPAAV